MKSKSLARALRLFQFTSFLVLGLATVVSPALAQMGGGGGMGHGGGSGSGTGQGNGNGNMGTGMGGAMLTSGGTPYRSDGRTLEMSDAIAIAGRYLTSTGYEGLALDEVEEWDFNYYVVVKETAPPQYKAFQLLIDKWTGAVMPEPGPNMMWNQKYRIRGGMGHHRPNGNGTQPMAITPEAAASAANRFLAERFISRPGAVVSTADTFYGYYNFDVMDPATGQKFGMLSVQGTTAQVWFHTWHGGFIQGQEIE